MYRSNSTRIVPVIVVIIIIIALVAGLVAVGRYLFGSNAQQTAQLNQQKTASAALLTVNANHSVRMIVRGPIVADEKFRSYQITVSPSSRNYTVYKGYLDSVDSTQNFDNNTQAYEQFVYALDKASLTRAGKYADSQANDIRGICATGSVYEFSILDGSNEVEHYWTSTCKGSPGTFGASVNQVTNLFVTQIPDLRNTFTTSSLSF